MAELLTVTIDPDKYPQLQKLVHVDPNLDILWEFVQRTLGERNWMVVDQHNQPVTHDKLRELVYGRGGMSLGAMEAEKEMLYQEACLALARQEQRKERGYVG